MEKKFFPEEIHGNRVLLRKHRIELAQTKFDYVDRDRERLGKFLPWVKFVQELQDEIDYIKMTHEKWATHGLFDYGIFDLQTQTYMGNIGVHSIAWSHARCELGYWILGDFEGKGFMADAVTSLESQCFAIGFHRVEIRCSSLNLRSASIPRRLGYRLEGVLKEDSIENGQFRDTLIFGKTRPNQEEFPAISGLNHVYLFVEDLRKSTDWYEAVLGISPLEKLENFTLFQIGNSELCLHPADSKSPVSTGGSVGYWKTLSLKNSIDRFKKHGAKVYRGPLDIGSRQSICQLKDPFGNVIGLVGPNG